MDLAFSQIPGRSFANGFDEMPGPRNNMRNKLFHQQGLVAKAKYIATEGNIYTGVFEGADNVLIRLSETDIIADDISTAANPSIAIKFLRDGRDSANQFGMVSFEGTNSWNFFANPFMSHLPVHEGECGSETVAKYNAQATPFIFQNGSIDMASFRQNGEQVTEPNFPFFMMFKPTEGLPVTDGTSRFFE